VLNQENKSRK